MIPWAIFQDRLNGLATQLLPAWFVCNSPHSLGCCIKTLTHLPPVWVVKNDRVDPYNSLLKKNPILIYIYMGSIIPYIHQIT